jgi:hypothetical protein
MACFKDGADASGSAFSSKVMKYTVNRGAQQIGQFELADIQALMNAGVILPTDVFWFQGMTEWKPVSSLFASQTSLAVQALPPTLPAAQTGGQPSVIITKDIGPSCASCFSTDVMKASAAYELHVKQHSLTAGTLSGLKFWASGETTNQVGANCAPPAQPEKPAPMLWSRLFVLISALTTTAFAASGLSAGQDGWGFLVLAFFTGLICFICVRAWRNAETEIEEGHKKAMNEYHSQMADYDRTWRCNKCGVMYLT